MYVTHVVALLIGCVSSAAGTAGQFAAPIEKRLPWYHTTQQVHEAMVGATKSCSGAQVELRSRPFTTAKSETSHLDVVYIRRPGVDPQKKALMVFGEHARELIAVESALDLVRTICGKGPNAEAASHVLDSVELVLVPNANPLSRQQVEKGMYCKRTNEDGVDLNRNWGDKHRDERLKGEEIDPGPHGFSEPETQVLRDLVDEEKPDIYLSVHSGAHLLGIPFGYSSGAKPHNAADMLEVLRPISENHCKGASGACPYGNLAQLVGYENGGCDIDYVQEQHHGSYVFTWEIYAGDSSPTFTQLRRSTVRQRFRSRQRLQMRLPESQQDPESCIRHFNPLTEVETRSVLENWTGAYLELCKLVVEKQAAKQEKQAKLGALALGSWLSKR